MKFKSQKSKVKICGIKISLLFASYFLINQIYAQSVSASLDRDKILLGEQVTLQLNVTGIDPATTYIETWPQVTDSLKHVEVIKKTAIDTIAVNNTFSYQQNFTVTGFDSGRWQLGAFNFALRNKLTGKKITLASPVIYLTVLTVDVSGMKNYHPLKDIIEVQPAFNWKPVIIIAIIIILALIVFIFLKKTKKQKIKPARIILQGTPIERATGKLQKLGDASLNSSTEIKKFHSDIDEICREYFEEIIHVQAMQATTAELLMRINVYMQDAGLKSTIHTVFEMNSAVKFAKYLPAPQESKRILNEVINGLKKIDALALQAKENADRLV